MSKALLQCTLAGAWPYLVLPALALAMAIEPASSTAALLLSNRTGGTAETVTLVLAETQEVVATCEILYHGTAVDFGTSRTGALAIKWVDTTSGQLRVRLL